MALDRADMRHTPSGCSVYLDVIQRGSLLAIRNTFHPWPCVFTADSVFQPLRAQRMSSWHFLTGTASRLAGHLRGDAAGPQPNWPPTERHCSCDPNGWLELRGPFNRLEIHHTRQPAVTLIFVVQSICLCGRRGNREGVLRRRASRRGSCECQTWGPILSVRVPGVRGT